MYRFILICLVCLFAPGILRADLILVQQSSASNEVTTVTTKIHGNTMRADNENAGFSVIVDFKTRDSITLLNKTKAYLQRSGTNILEQMQKERARTQGTNDMDAKPAQPVDTGKSETVNGYETEIYTWSGARGITETLWVAKNFPNLDDIRPELVKLDQFNDTGPHRNAQPPLAGLPGMVVKAESAVKGFKITVSLISAELKPVDESVFQIPAGYPLYKTPAAPKPATP